MMPSTVLDADSLTDLHNFLSLAPLSIAHIFGYGNYLTFTTCQAVRNHILSSDSTFFCFSMNEMFHIYINGWSRGSSLSENTVELIFMENRCDNCIISMH